MRGKLEKLSGKGTHAQEFPPDHGYLWEAALLSSSPQNSFGGGGWGPPLHGAVMGAQGFPGKHYCWDSAELIKPV